MQLNTQIGGGDSVLSEQVGSSEDGQFDVALRKIVKKEIEVMMIRQGNLMISPITELVRNVVKEELQSVVDVIIERILASGNWTNTNTMTMSNEGRLILKFLDEEPDDVLTGKEIKGKSGTLMRVAIIDEVTGQVVESGPESSAKVEILLLEATENGNEHNWSHQDFNSRILNESDKTKPHFAKSYYVYLERGIGTLSNAKLANNSKWTKSCKCRLGARVNLSGIMVQEAWTEPFEVSDSRGWMYKKHHPPHLSDPVWRLEKIGKNGVPCKNLKKNKVSTVGDFLFMLSVDPQKLQEIIRSTATWNMIVDHAKTCIIDDPRICIYNDTSECDMCVVFDVVGRMKGVIRGTHFIPNNDLSKDEKDRAQGFLLSAFENREDITYFADETTFLHHFPYLASAAVDNCFQDICDPPIPEIISCCNSTESGSSPQAIIPLVGPVDNENNVFNPDSATLRTMARLDSLSPVHLPYSNLISEYLGLNQSVMSPSHPEGSNVSETLEHEQQAHQQSNVGTALLVRAVAVMLWMFRAKKRALALGQREMHVSKRQKII